jgi:hypothetical protein
MRVYIAGPYTKGDVVMNVQKIIRVAEKLIKFGHIPFVPHLTHLWHLINPHSYRFWLEYDSKWLPICDALLRVPGESSGADEEVGLAKGLGIPVYYTIEDLIRCAT